MTKTLETYDPNWNERWEDIHRQLQASHKEPYSEARHANSIVLNEQLQAAFHAQFETAAHYRDWLFDKVREQAERANVAFIMPVLSDDCTVEQVRAAYSVASKSIEQREREPQYSLPTFAPQEGKMFSRALKTTETRDAFTFDYVGFHGIASKCGITIERRDDKAAICFTHLPDATGTAPMGCVEDLATLFYNQRLKSQYQPEQVSFHIHVPVAITASAYRNEIFINVGLSWNVQEKSFHSPEWMHQTQVPEVIKEAEKLHLFAAASRPADARKKSGFNFDPYGPRGGQR